MSDFSNQDSRLSPTSRAPKKQSNSNRGAWIVMSLAFLVAMAIYLYLSNQSHDRFDIAVLNRDVAVGTKIDASMVRRASINASKSQLERMVMFDDIESVAGNVAVAPLGAGDPLLRSSLRTASSSNGLRTMSIPVDKERAVAGNLNVGDRVDVIDTTQNFPDGIAARNLEVVGVQAANASALGGGGGFSVTVAVTANDAINIAKSVNGNKFLIVRSTGATPLSDSVTTT